LAEDNSVSAAVAQAMLANLGFDVDVVTDGAKAVEAAIHTRYQAILLDCQIPVLDGYQTATEIRRLQSGSRRTPIIAVTATPMRSGQEHCLDAGMDDYLAKPYTLKALAAVLVRWAPDRSLRTAVLDHAEPRPTVQNEPSEVPDSARAVLDPAVVGRLDRLGTAADKDLFGQLTILFLADARVRVATLRRGLDREDAAAVTRAAHMLSGASANLGAAKLAHLCADFAADDAAGQLTGGRRRLAMIETELDRVRIALRMPMPVPMP
jgi:CheY-like chemotaxis protein/HPt (histidine-containing phosphotransfer) domain-containing protein